ncbi:MAG: nitrate/nitrite transporter NrtS [Myxococcota bacterium]|nr:nitrate/nitrite transporter NrtS [Myxococcota bacterium]
MTIRRVLTTALEPTIIRRGLRYSAVVGTILVLINQSDAFLGGEFGGTQICQILLTYSVPFIVSSVSSAQALLAHDPDRLR